MVPFKKEEKYLVLKRDDIAKLKDTPQAWLGAICKRIRKYREVLGKKENHYIVVNEDELYAPTVWKLIELGELGAGSDDYRDIISSINFKLDYKLMEFRGTPAK